MKKFLADLFQEPEQQRQSISRFWVNVILAVSTWVVVRMELTGRTSFEVLGTYMGLVLGYEAVKRGVTRHFDSRMEIERLRVERTNAGHGGE